MLAIVIGSTFKGIIAGVIMGFIARKYQSLPIGIIVGLLVGAVLAFFVAHMQGKYYFESCCLAVLLECLWDLLLRDTVRLLQSPIERDEEVMHQVFCGNQHWQS